VPYPAWRQAFRCCCLLGRLGLAAGTLSLAVTGCGGGSRAIPASNGARATTTTPSGDRDRPAALSPAARGDPERIYVPNSNDGTVTEIDPTTFRIIRTFSVGELPQHVIPSYDLKTLWVANNQGNSLTRIDPRSGRPGRTIAVEDPYNLYYTPDGRDAIVVAERLQRLDFRDPRTMRLRRSLPVDCAGINHMDFTPNGRYALASCEFAGKMALVDLRRRRVARYLALPPGSSPQDVKLSPDGRLFYVADRYQGGVYLIRARRPRIVGFVATGADAHGLYVSRDRRRLYVSNRSGSVSVISFARRKVIATWPVSGGSPDMGGVSPDGRTLWLSGRYDGEVYAIDTRSGRLRARIPVGSGPHGLSVFPQPGRHSLGHTGVFR
jgi:DNA-binding beta-propeller fold protein YncE